MTDRPQQLNPPQTPLCPKYMDINIKWAYVYAADDKQARILTDKYEAELREHRASCPQCRKRMLEINEEAKVAKEPEVKDD